MRLATQRLVLRGFVAKDFDAVHAYASDPEVSRYMDWGPNTPADTAVFLDAAMHPSPERMPFAVTLRGSGALIGAAELIVTSGLHGRGELGYVLAREHWGQGYATEAAGALLRLGFEELGLFRISATCDPDNPASARVLEKIGMAREGLLRGYFLIRGARRDRLLYAAVASGRPDGRHASTAS